MRNDLSDTDTIEILRAIKSVLDRLMNDPGTGVHVRLNELYDHARRDLLVQRALPTSRAFSQFMRAEHNSMRLRSVIPNYTVDTFVHERYEWFFHREVVAIPAEGKADSLLSNDRYKDHKKKIRTSSGELVRSHQERFIHDALNRVPHFTFRYEFPLRAIGRTRNVDFHIINNKTRTEYFWEHFGMTNSPTTATSMTSIVACSGTSNRSGDQASDRAPKDIGDVRRVALMS